MDSLGSVPNLLTIRFELDISLLVHQPVNYITVTLTAAQIEDKDYTVDDLKDVIFSRVGLSRTSFWMGLPSSGDSHVWEVPYTCFLEDLVLYYINSRRVRPIGYIDEYSRRDTLYPYRTLPTLAARLHDDAIGQLRLPLTAYLCFREIPESHPFPHALRSLVEKNLSLPPSERRVCVTLESQGSLRIGLFLVFVFIKQRAPGAEIGKVPMKTHISCL